MVPELSLVRREDNPFTPYRSREWSRHRSRLIPTLAGRVSDAPRINIESCGWICILIVLTLTTSAAATETSMIEIPSRTKNRILLGRRILGLFGSLVSGFGWRRAEARFG